MEGGQKMEGGEAAQNARSEGEGRGEPCVEQMCSMSCAK
jgi:hypothetical protein